MCAGLPVVATAVGGVPELVSESQTGLLIPERDPATLAEALRKLADDPERRGAMGLAGRSRVFELFSLERSISSLERIYAEASGLEAIEASDATKATSCDGTRLPHGECRR